MPRKSSKPKSLSRSKLIKAISDKTRIDEHDVEDVLDGLAVVVQEAVGELPAGAKIVVPGVVTLRMRLAAARPAHIGRNPATGEPIEVSAKPERLDLKVKVADELKTIAQSRASLPTRR